LHHIGEVVPITPVPLTAKAITMLKKDSIDRTELIDTIARIYASLINDHRKIIIDTAYRHYDEVYAALINGEKHHVRIDEQWLMDDAKRITDEALAILERRGIVKFNNNQIIINTQKRHFIEYYSNAITHLF
ncbi:MAG: hypothetical protein U9P80_09520, partial [Thermodesulfobacteriota bacterium]|nr:hypothetical protein [Thermodesulfobacteriota bacterium]